MASASASASAAVDQDLEKMMWELGLREEDLDDLVFEEEVRHDNNQSDGWPWLRFISRGNSATTGSFGT